MVMSFIMIRVYCVWIS